MEIKRQLLKSLRLDKDLIAYNGTRNENDKKQIALKFKAVWGGSLAYHFLSKYDNADSLIWALDSDNLQLFIDNY